MLAYLTGNQEQMSGSRNRTHYNNPAELESRIEFYQKYGQRINKEGWFPWVSDNIEISETDSVLEIGCGSGDLWSHGNWRSNPARDLILSDISEVMIEQSRSKLCNKFPSFQYACVDVHDIPFADESFDVVIANHVLHLTEDLDRSLREIKRVLVEGGTLYSTTKYKHNFGGIDNILQNVGINENISGIDQFQVNEAGRILSRFFDSVCEQLFKEVYNITESEVDALVYFADSKLNLDEKTKSYLRKALCDQIQQRQVADNTKYTIAMEKYMALLTAQKA
jgi:ubiquinone/menaquinone biosynthesis C-methylase UbiE